MRRLFLLVALAALVAPSAASAHPLGNFSFNHLSEVRISSDRVEVTYLLDQAEIPTFQERGKSSPEVIADKRAEVLERLDLTVDGSPADLRPAAPAELELRPGQGGLETTRFELDLVARVDDPRNVELHDGTFPDRLGWRAVVIQPGSGTAVRSDAPSGDPTKRLTVYPTDLLESPLDRRDGSFEVKPGDGTVVAPRAEGGEAVENQGEDGFAGLFEDAASGEGVLVLLLLAAFGWGALHALSPGHGKAMVAAYLVGTRGTPRHAIALGGIVTVTHTIGVFALGLVTLALSQYVLPEDLYPWLTLASGLLVVAVGAGVLRSRLRTARAKPHSHGDHHPHHHHHDVSWKGLLGMGASAGLIPCPSALVVLLAAIAQHEVGLGLVLIVVFSLGLATTLTVLGLAVVYAGRLTTRLHVPARIVTAVPAVSAALIVGVGCVLTAGAVPDVLSS
jgi:ABC-type nickel/cobalt efflux system permease component RcnA